MNGPASFLTLGARGKGGTRGEGPPLFRTGNVSRLLPQTKREHLSPTAGEGEGRGLFPYPFTGIVSGGRWGSHGAGFAGLWNRSWRMDGESGDPFGAGTEGSGERFFAPDAQSDNF